MQTGTGWMMKEVPWLNSMTHSPCDGPLLPIFRHCERLLLRRRKASIDHLSLHGWSAYDDLSSEPSLQVDVTAFSTVAAAKIRALLHLQALTAPPENIQLGVQSFRESDA